MAFRISYTAIRNVVYNIAAKGGRITPISTLTFMSTTLRIFEYLLCLFLDPVGVALAPQVESSQELRASRTEYAIVKLLMSLSSCFVYSHNLVYYPFRSSLYA